MKRWSLASACGSIAVDEGRAVSAVMGLLADKQVPFLPVQKRHRSIVKDLDARGCGGRCGVGGFWGELIDTTASGPGSDGGAKMYQRWNVAACSFRTTIPSLLGEFSEILTFWMMG